MHDLHLVLRPSEAVGLGVGCIDLQDDHRMAGFPVTKHRGDYVMSGQYFDEYERQLAEAAGREAAIYQIRKTVYVTTTNGAFQRIAGREAVIVFEGRLAEMRRRNRRENDYHDDPEPSQVQGRRKRKEYVQRKYHFFEKELDGSFRRLHSDPRTTTGETDA